MALICSSVTDDANYDEDDRNEDGVRNEGDYWVTELSGALPVVRVKTRCDLEPGRKTQEETILTSALLGLNVDRVFEECLWRMKEKVNVMRTSRPRTLRLKPVYRGQVLSNSISEKTALTIKTDAAVSTDTTAVLLHTAENPTGPLHTAETPAVLLDNAETPAVFLDTAGRLNNAAVSSKRPAVVLHTAAGVRPRRLYRQAGHWSHKPRLTAVTSPLSPDSLSDGSR